MDKYFFSNSHSLFFLILMPSLKGTLTSSVAVTMELLSKSVVWLATVCIRATGVSEPGWAGEASLSQHSGLQVWVKVRPDCQQTQDEAEKS